MANDLQKHTLHLREGDWDYIESIYKSHGIATSLIIRSLVSNFVDKKRKQEKDSPETLGDVNIDL